MMDYNELTILPPNWVLPPKVTEYWQSLIDDDLLKYRLADIKNPSQKDVDWLTSTYAGSMFYIIHEQRVCGEVTLEGFTGLAAKIHFSAAKGAKGDIAILGAKKALEFIFGLRRSQDRSVPWVHSVIGVTPESNKLAVRYMKRVGFTPLAVLPKALRLEYCDMIDNAVLSIKENPYGYGWQ